MARVERDYQPKLIKRIERLFAVDLDTIAYVRKIDVQQGWPDLLILAPCFWALIEVKREKPSASDYEPNQEWWIDHFDAMSFSACIYPENEQEVLHALSQTFRRARG